MNNKVFFSSSNNTFSKWCCEKSLCFSKDLNGIGVWWKCMHWLLSASLQSADTWKCWSERIWSCYISRETWIHALYFRLNWRKRHVRNLFREKDIDHFDNQMCGRHFLLKPGVHKLLEIKKIWQTYSNEMIVDKPTNWKWRYCQLTWISITASF